MLSTGIPEVDQQHAALDAALVDVEKALLTRDESWPAKLQALVELACVHFECEERELERCQYPHIENHRQLHNWLRFDLRKAACYALRASGLRTQFFKHIETHDASWAEWLWSLREG